jgi:MarR family transcriptional regulator, organic hydroperoxide resistance regulator
VRFAIPVAYDSIVHYSTDDTRLEDAAGGSGTSTTLENPLALENQVCFQVAVAARSVLGVYRPILEPLGLTHPQYLVMLVLWENGDSSVRDLGTALRLDSATLSPLLKRLEAAGLVRRARSGNDERVVVVSLTEEGTALRKRALEVPGRVVATLGLELSELESLRDGLSAFISAADARAR